MTSTHKRGTGGGLTRRTPTSPELFKAFARIATGQVPSRPIPAEFGVSGSVFRYRRHFVYWKILGNGDVGIVTVLHQRMHQVGRLREDFDWEGVEGSDDI